MRRRFGIPLTAALILLIMMVRPFWPLASIEPYYVLAGISTLWSVFDSIRLEVRKHGSSPLLSPVALAAWMLIAWPLAFPWYLKVHYLVSNGESADKVGSFAAIRLAFLGIFVVGGALFVGGGAMVLKYVPGVRDYLATSLLASRQLTRQFGGSASLAMSSKRELVITMAQNRADDSLSNQRFARQVARYAHSHLPDADSLKSIEVVLQDSATSKSRGRYKWTVAELRGEARPSSQPETLLASTSGALPSTAPAPSSVAPRRGGAAQPTAATVIPAGAPATATKSAPTRRPAPTHALARLAAADPAVRWLADSTLVADVDCDGMPDTVAMARKRAEVHVGIARAGDPEPQILVFDVGRGVKGAVSGIRAAISLESLDWDPAERGLQGLAGFRRSTSCKGVKLADAGDRGAHIFWSHSTKHVEWYQR
jgi:hypothetical protein